MSKKIRVRMKSYIQPFERELAKQELRVIAEPYPVLFHDFGATPIEYEFNSDASARDLARRLAYWETVEDEDGLLVTTQSLRESTVNLVRNGIAIESLRAQLPFTDKVPFPNRRVLRYGTHGIHEYRGKFFPQLVRSLINISGTKVGGIVADPMSGSGTTVVEAVLAGCIGRGLDMNPMSVFLAQTKSRLLKANPHCIALNYEQIRLELLSSEDRSEHQLSYFDQLPVVDQQYLKTWFSEDVLSGLDDIMSAISKLNDEDARDLAIVAVSNIIRKVSWQKEDDLRVRKEIRLDLEIDPKKEFLEELGRSVRAVLALLYQNENAQLGESNVIEGDAKNCGALWGENSIDVIITSPPYATALPYLDTDRLSLCYLKLLPRPEHRTRDQQMIGNREITEGQRKAYWARYKEKKDLLPPSIYELISKIENLNAGTDVGFRRLNLPALLSKYFFDMREVILGMKLALKPGAFAFVVVGNNHTIAGGQRVDIQTAGLLKEIARDAGFEVADSISMEMLLSRDIFKKNAMGSEEILAFRKPF